MPSDDFVPTTDDLKIPDRTAVEQSGDFCLSGVVNPQSAQELVQAMYRFAKGKLRKNPQTRPRMTLSISSGGGSVNSALDIYGAIMRIRCEWGFGLDTVAYGFAGSAACTLLQAGERRFISPYAQLLVHDISGVVFGSYDEIFRTHKKSFDISRLSMASILAHNNTAGHTDPQWWIDNYFDVDHFLAAPEALALGLVDEILPLYVRTGGITGGATIEGA